jgi:hypothetical protein
LKAVNKPEIQQSVSNLEWNAKKVKGGSGAEGISPEDWAKDTQYDLNQIAKAAGGTAGQTASSLAAEIGKAFGSVAAGGEPAAAASTAAASISAANPAAPTESATAAAGGVDVNTMLAGLAAKSGEQLDWKNSVVDLLKALGADSSLAGRKRVAAAIGWSESEIGKIGSEAGNQSLHNAILTYLSTHGGKLPS